MLYTDELLAHVARFLFPEPKAGNDTYLCVLNDTQNVLFQNARVELSKSKQIRISPAEGGASEWKDEQGKLWPTARGGAIEVFLSEHGVGLISIGLTMKKPGGDAMPGLDGIMALDANYGLARRSPMSSARLRLPHPSEDQDKWAKIPEPNRARIAPAPAEDSPISERLGVPGGSFTLFELVEQLLAPLSPLGLRLRDLQEGFSVYSVVRLGEEVDFQDPSARELLSVLLSGLCQVEEPCHAGALVGQLGTPDEILNRKHWSAVGQLGAAHLVADQPDTPFNEERVGRAFDKYFIPYFMILLQRLVLHRVMDQSARITRSAEESDAHEFAELRGKLLQFAVNGHFLQLSSRHSVHRFYQLSRKGMAVDEAWLDVRRSIADTDAMYSSQGQMAMTRELHATVEQQTQLASKMEESLRIIAHVQQMVDWIEIVLISVYSAHLMHMLIEPLTSEHPHYSVTAAVLGAAILAGGLAAFLMKPWKHKKGKGH